LTIVFIILVLSFSCRRQDTRRSAGGKLDEGIDWLVQISQQRHSDDTGNGLGGFRGRAPGNDFGMLQFKTGMASHLDLDLIYQIAWHPVKQLEGCIARPRILL
jgi:hypothetical protein